MAGTEAADERALRSLAGAWRVPLSDTQAGGLFAYGNLLLTWSARINLTAARSVSALIETHFPDAFALASRLDSPATVVDVGSGGGLPALPLALLRPTLTVDLCEPIAKKGAFLRTAIRELGLAERLHLHQARGETLAETHAARFDAAISRATLPPAQWLALGRRLVRPGGRVFALAAADAVPAGLTGQLYLGGRRALVEVTVPAASTDAPLA